MKALRPPWCQDKSCCPQANTPGAVGSLAAKHGNSGFCCGVVPDLLVTERGNVRHENDGHLCFRSPVRGVVMLEINATDLENVARVALHSLVAREPSRPFNWRWFTGDARLEGEQDRDR